MGDSLFRIPFWLTRQRLLPQHHLVVTQFLRSQAFLVLFSVTRSKKNRYLLAHEIKWCYYIQWRYVGLCCDFFPAGVRSTSEKPRPFLTVRLATQFSNWSTEIS